MEDKKQFQLTSAFFGLTLTYRVNLFKQIHEIIFHGKGGYDYHTVYNMPIWLRNVTFNYIQTYYDEEKKAYEKAQKGKSSSTTLVSEDGTIAAPEFAQYKKTSYK